MRYLLSYIVILFVGLTFAQTVSPEDLKVGQLAPAFEGKLLDGSPFNLKKAKGNLILLDFWASWCGPCRQENPNVVKIYDELKNQKFVNGKKFMIVSISLDMQEQAWIKAIEKDQLKWETHLIDPAGKIAKMYNVRFIPSAFLIDKKGTIIEMGESLRGHNLKETSNKYKK